MKPLYHGFTYDIFDGERLIQKFVTEDDSLNALEIMQFYGFNDKCYDTGSLNRLNYFLVDDSAPYLPYSSETCFTFDPFNLTINNSEDQWNITYDSLYVVYDLRSEDDALEAIKIIQNYSFTKRCTFDNSYETYGYFLGPELPLKIIGYDAGDKDSLLMHDNLYSGVIDGQASDGLNKFERIAVYIQNQGSKTVMINDFVKLGGTNYGKVYVGSNTFLQNYDSPSDFLGSLGFVVVEKGVEGSPALILSDYELAPYQTATVLFELWDPMKLGRDIQVLIPYSVNGKTLQSMGTIVSGQNSGGAGSIGPDISSIQGYNEDFTGFPPIPEVRNPKLDTQIEQMLRYADPEEYADTHGLEYHPDGQFRFLVYVINPSDDVKSRISQFAYIEETHENKIQILLGPAQIYDLISSPDIYQIRNPGQVHLHQTVSSEGVSVIKADQAHQKGFTGKGVKVAILDMAFDTQNSEIKENIIESKSFRHDFLGKKMPVMLSDGENVHGTSVAEIVLDVAPDSEIYLGTFARDLEFTNAVDWAVSKDVDIITMSAGWVKYLTDGQTSMTKRVEKAIQDGTVFVISSGNYAQNHWEGIFTDSNSNSFHEFASGDEGMSVDVTRETLGTPLIFSLVWEETGNEMVNFKLGLIDPAGNLVAHSANEHRTKQDRHQEVFFKPKISGKYTVSVQSQTENHPPTQIELFSPFTKFETFNEGGSVGVPNDANGVISVGAVNFRTLELEPYSSQGPTNSGDNVPVLVGPDAVTTNSFGNFGVSFEGTSAAAPHIAGLAALILQSNPEATPSEISQLLTTNTKSIGGNLGWNSRVGHGLADASFLDKQKGTVKDFLKIPTQWWLDGEQTDRQFGNTLWGFIKSGAIKVDAEQTGQRSDNVSFPDWFKSQTAEWYVSGQTPPSAFADAIANLIKQGILVV